MSKCVFNICKSFTICRRLFEAVDARGRELVYFLRDADCLLHSITATGELLSPTALLQCHKNISAIPYRVLWKMATTFAYKVIKGR